MIEEKKRKKNVKKQFIVIR